MSRLLGAASERLAPQAVPPPSPEEQADGEPDELVRGELVELQAHLPPQLAFDRDTYVHLFASLEVCSEPVTFEIVATAERIAIQVVVCPRDESFVRQELDAFLPEVTFSRAPGYLAKAWGEAETAPVAVAEFGCGKEFVVPFAVTRRDLFVGLIGALNGLRLGETAVFQVIFSPASERWRDAILQAVTHTDGSALFVNAPEVLPAAKEKTAVSLFAAVVRLAVRAEESPRAWEIACDAAGALGAYGSVFGNELIPLRNDEYPYTEHESDLLARQSRRSGMILNAAELAGFVHMPSGEVKADRLRLFTVRSKAAPAAVTTDDGLRLGANTHAGVTMPVALNDTQRAAHVYVIGASGTGKSTLLYNIAVQAMERGEGISILDPHGELIDRVLAAVPKHRIHDVAILDPSDPESVVGFNVLAGREESEKSLLASDLVAVFRRLSDAWGHQLNSVLSNALLAFMESDRGGTLLDVRRSLLEPKFRAEHLASVRDPEVAYYWKHAFPQLAGNRSVGPVVTRLDAFLAPKVIRQMVGLRENKIDFRDIMDSGRIFLAKLSQGALGRENARLFGGLLVAKMQAEAMSRQRTAETARRFHSLLIDEFHDFLTPSLAECLTGVRKYRLGLVLAHQERSQLGKETEVASAVLNTHTRIVFRVNETDARGLADGFTTFDARDLINIPNWQTICRVERSDHDFNLAVDAPEFPEPEVASKRRGEVVAASRSRYGIPRAEAERALYPAPAPVSPPVSVPVAVPVALPVPDARKSVAPSTPPGEEVRPAVLPVKKTAVPSFPASPDLGKGGIQHKAIQKRIRDAAEALGFRATIEKAILDGAGSIDLALERRDVSFACEITVSTTIDHEVGNVAKCANAGWKRVVAIAVTPRKLADLKQAVLVSLGSEIASLVAYYLPDAFIEYLQKLPPPGPVAPEVKTVKGYRVKTKFPALSPAEAKAKEDSALAVMARLMKAKRRGE